MCTLTWALAGEDYDLLFSRDERRTRLPAVPPRAGERNGVRYVAPRDGDFGGSWIAATERGLTVCLLNLYDPRRPPGPDAAYTSRGLLLLEAVDAATAEAAAARLAGADLPRYRPFSAVAFGPAEPPRLVEWDGVDVLARDLAADDRPFVSSGYDADGARRARRAEFARRAAAATLDAGALEEFHRSHAPERGPQSVCMHRDDAATVSLARVAARPDAMTMWYAAGPPCETPFGPPLVLARRR